MEEKKESLTSRHRHGVVCDVLPVASSQNMRRLYADRKLNEKGIWNLVFQNDNVFRLMRSPFITPGTYRYTYHWVHGTSTGSSSRERTIVESRLGLPNGLILHTNDNDNDY
jgi:hypothetical protein